MGFGVKSRPLVVVFGTVLGVSERRKRAENGGDVYAHDVTVETPGGPAYLRFWARDLAYAPTSVGETIAVGARIDENDATVSFERRLEPGDLDFILSASGLAAASK